MYRGNILIKSSVKRYNIFELYYIQYILLSCIFLQNIYKADILQFDFKY